MYEYVYRRDGKRIYGMRRVGQKYVIYCILLVRFYKVDDCLKKPRSPSSSTFLVRKQIKLTISVSNSQTSLNDSLSPLWIPYVANPNI